MKYCLLMGDDFEEIEAITQIDILRRAGIEVDIFGIGKEYLIGRQKIVIKSEKIFNTSSDVDINLYEGIILPGGPGVVAVSENSEVRKTVVDFYNSKKLIFAICAAPLVLDKAGILKDKKFTCYPATAKDIENGMRLESNVVVDKNIVTSQGVGTSIDAALKLVEIIKSKEEALSLAEKIVYKYIC